MHFEKIIPCVPLQPCISHFVVSEQLAESQYKVLPSAGLVVGFQYRGSIGLVHNGSVDQLSISGITGINDRYKIFANSPDTGTILVFFTPAGLAHFTTHPAHELFNQSVSLDNIFDRNKVAETEDRLALATGSRQRIRIVEDFLLKQLKDIQQDRLVTEAVKLIYQSGGTIKIKALAGKLFISQSPLEKRFRKLVGTSPKKFAAIIRFNSVLEDLEKTKSLTSICYENNFFDQSHFIRDFKQFTGDTPENFKLPG